MRYFLVIAFALLLGGTMLCTPVSAADLELLQEQGTVGGGVPYAGNRSPKMMVRLPKKYVPKKNEFRGIWVAQIENIDFPKTPTAADFRAAFDDLLNRVHQAGFTAQIFQVRPMNDAVYHSEINPFSGWVTGTEGKTFSDEPVFDPLAYMIRETHQRNMEFHAWLNPYRVANGIKAKKKDYQKTLSPKNYAAQHEDFVQAVPTGNGKNVLILNPGEPEVVNYQIRTVHELLLQYDLDAIHFDDYFYPYYDIGNLDAAAKKKYAPADMSTEDWRRENVNTLIRNVSLLIRRHNKANQKHVRFGISPFGIWANAPSDKPAVSQKTPPVPSMPAGSLTSGTQSYFKQYADTRKWIREGWIDYIVPQIYWSFSHRTAPYAALADWWADTVKGTNTDLYVGHGVYRVGTSTDWKDPDELLNQLRFNCLRPEIKGSSFFSYCRIFNPENSAQKNAAAKMIGTYWKKQYSPVSKSAKGKEK